VKLETIRDVAVTCRDAIEEVVEIEEVVVAQRLKADHANASAPRAARF
jgi:hypothetical protein